MKKLFFALVLLVLAAHGLKAQSNVLRIKMSDGEDIIWTSEKLNNIYFDGDTTLVVVESENYFTHSYNVNEIKKMYFESGESVPDLNFTEVSLVYPNPAKDNIRIVGIDNQEIEIISIDGKSVFKGNYDGISLDVSNFPQGAYIIKTNSSSLKFNKI